MEVKVIVEKVNKLLVCPQIIIKSDYHTEIQLLHDLLKGQFGPTNQFKLKVKFFTSL